MSKIGVPSALWDVCVVATTPWFAGTISAIFVALWQHSTVPSKQAFNGLCRLKEEVLNNLRVLNSWLTTKLNVGRVNPLITALLNHLMIVVHDNTRNAMALSHCFNRLSLFPMLQPFDEWSEWSGLSPLIRPVSCWCFAASLFRSLMNSQYGIELPRKLNLCSQKPFRPTPLPFSKRSQNLLVTHPSSRLIQNKIDPRLDDSQEKPPIWCFREIRFPSPAIECSAL